MDYDARGTIRQEVRESRGQGVNWTGSQEYRKSRGRGDSGTKMPGYKEAKGQGVKRDNWIKV